MQNCRYLSAVNCHQTTKLSTGAVLCFLPGITHGTDSADMLSRLPKHSSYDFSHLSPALALARFLSLSLTSAASESEVPVGRRDMSLPCGYDLICSAPSTPTLAQFSVAQSLHCCLSTPALSLSVSFPFPTSVCPLEVKRLSCPLTVWYCPDCFCSMPPTSFPRAHAATWGPCLILIIYQARDWQPPKGSLQAP